MAATCKRLPGQETCPQDQKPLVLECLTCEKILVCTDCILHSHNGHNFRDIKETIPETKQVINDFVNISLQQSVPDLNTDVNATVAKLQEINTVNSDIILRLKEQATKAKEIIDELLKDSINLLEKWRKQNEALLNSHKSLLEKLSADIVTR